MSLKPCPCCGHHVIYPGYHSQIERAFVHCWACGLKMEQVLLYLRNAAGELQPEQGETQEAYIERCVVNAANLAAEKWNRRPDERKEG